MRNFKLLLTAVTFAGFVMVSPPSGSASVLALGADVGSAEMTTPLVEQAGHRGHRKWRHHGHHGKWRHYGHHGKWRRHYAYRYHNHRRYYGGYWPYYGSYGYSGCGYPAYGYGYGYGYPYCGGYGGPFITFGFGF